MLRAAEVFTPGAYPTYTYVQRTQSKLEDNLRDALETPGQVVSLSGPSKSGKTVLVEHVVGRDNLITLTGAGLSSPDDIWDRVLDWMDSPGTISQGTTLGGTAGIAASGKGGTSFLGIVRAEVEGKGSFDVTGSHGKSETRGRRGLAQVVEEIANSSFVVLLDDFHYMPRDLQIEVAKSIKEAVRLGVKIVTASVTHRGDDVVRANPELRGRVRAIDLSYWANNELWQIAASGFDALNIDVEPSAVHMFVAEAAGSPQLMQSICLNACFAIGLRVRESAKRTVEIPSAKVHDIFKRTSTSTDFRSLVDVLDAGPKTRGTERKIYVFRDSTEGDVYRCILKAVATDPPRLSFAYDELLVRVGTVCKADVPVGGSIIGTCLHMHRLAAEKFPRERAIDWDEEKHKLDIPDPYLLFYLRWSGRLQE
jgi:hypothetical protein